MGRFPHTMLEKPDLPDQEIITCLRDDYGLRAGQVAFLPLGADRNTAVYHAVAGDGKPYFVKLRWGDFDEVSVTLPRFLSDQGISQIIPPLATRTGRLWASRDAFKAILYPFIAGRDGYEVDLSDRHWREFGAALKKIHATEVPPTLLNRIPRETWSPRWREVVRTSLKRIEWDTFDEPVAAKMAAFLKARRNETLDLVERAEQFARVLQAQPPQSAVCHSDLHAGNFLIDDRDTLYIVDWDNPIRAPKERDLMFAGGGLMGGGRTPQEEEALFYSGYGETQVDAAALAYYRYERIVEDIAVYCEQLLSSDEGGEDREQSLHYLMSNFLPNHTIEIACTSDKSKSSRNRSGVGD